MNGKRFSVFNFSIYICISIIMLVGIFGILGCGTSKPQNSYIGTFSSEDLYMRPMNNTDYFGIGSGYKYGVPVLYSTGIWHLDDSLWTHKVIRPFNNIEHTYIGYCSIPFDSTYSRDFLLAAGRMSSGCTSLRPLLGGHLTVVDSNTIRNWFMSWSDSIPRGFGVTNSIWVYVDSSRCNIICSMDSIIGHETCFVDCSAGVETLRVPWIVDSCGLWASMRPCMQNDTTVPPPNGRDTLPPGGMTCGNGQILTWYYDCDRCDTTYKYLLREEPYPQHYDTFSCITCGAMVFHIGTALMGYEQVFWPYNCCVDSVDTGGGYLIEQICNSEHTEYHYTYIDSSHNIFIDSSTIIQGPPGQPWGPWYLTNGSGGTRPIGMGDTVRLASTSGGFMYKTGCSEATCETTRHTVHLLADTVVWEGINQTWTTYSVGHTQGGSAVRYDFSEIRDSGSYAVANWRLANSVGGLQQNPCYTGYPCVPGQCARWDSSSAMLGYPTLIADANGNLRSFPGILDSVMLSQGLNNLVRVFGWGDMTPSNMMKDRNSSLYGMYGRDVLGCISSGSMPEPCNNRHTNCFGDSEGFIWPDFNYSSPQFYPTTPHPMGDGWGECGQSGWAAHEIVYIKKFTWGETNLTDDQVNGIRMSTDSMLNVWAIADEYLDFIIVNNDTFALGYHYNVQQYNPNYMWHVDTTYRALDSMLALNNFSFKIGPVHFKYGDSVNTIIVGIHHNDLGTCQSNERFRIGACVFFGTEFPANRDTIIYSVSCQDPSVRPFDPLHDTLRILTKDDIANCVGVMSGGGGIDNNWVRNSSFEIGNHKSGNHAVNSWNSVVRGVGGSIVDSVLAISDSSLAKGSYSFLAWHESTSVATDTLMEGVWQDVQLIHPLEPNQPLVSTIRWKTYLWLPVWNPSACGWATFAKSRYDTVHVRVDLLDRTKGFVQRFQTDRSVWGTDADKPDDYRENAAYCRAYVDDSLCGRVHYARLSYWVTYSPGGPGMNSANWDSSTVFFDCAGLFRSESAPRWSPHYVAENDDVWADTVYSHAYLSKSPMIIGADTITINGMVTFSNPASIKFLTVDTLFSTLTTVTTTSFTDVSFDSNSYNFPLSFITATAGLNITIDSIRMLVSIMPADSVDSIFQWFLVADSMFSENWLWPVYDTLISGNAKIITFPLDIGAEIPHFSWYLMPGGHHGNANARRRCQWARIYWRLATPAP